MHHRLHPPSPVRPLPLPPPTSLLLFLRSRPSPVVDVDVPHAAHSIRHLHCLITSSVVPIAEIVIAVDPNHRVTRVVGILTIDRAIKTPHPIADIPKVDVFDPDHKVVSAIGASTIHETIVVADIPVVVVVVPAYLSRPAIDVTTVVVDVVPPNHRTRYIATAGARRHIDSIPSS